MARKPDPATTVHDEANLIQGVAKHFLHKVYGAEGMPWGTKFSDLEELAVQIGQAIAQGIIEQGVADQAEHVPQEAETCGVCGQAVRGGPSPEPQELTTSVGPVQWSEPKRYCPKCRAAFFPSGPGLGD